MHDDSTPSTPLSEPPLVVALDGALTPTDTLHEAIAAHLSAEPLSAPSVLARALGGGGALRAGMAETRLARAAELPLHEPVLDLVRAARAEGRRTILVGRAAQAQVDAIAAETGLFEEAHGLGGPDSAGAMAGEDLAAFLTGRFGADGYDFIGAGADCTPAWRMARRSFTVGADAALIATVDAAAGHAEHILPAPRGAAKWKPWIKEIRPRQWAKNALIFAPLLAAHQLDGLGACIAAFIAFSLLASSVYLVNDMLDLKADRAHPRKRERPFAAAAIPILGGAIAAPGLALSAILIALIFTPTAFLGVLAVYYVLTFAYSLTLKRQLILDIWTLSGLYTLRIVAGAAAAALPLSPWMLGFSIFLFLSLAAVKRMAELDDQVKRGVEKTEGRAYRTTDLPVVRGLAMSTGTASVLALALYISSPEAQMIYSAPQLLWFVCLLMLYWVSRMVMVTHRGDMHDDPVVFAMKDRVSLAVLALCALSFVAAGTL